MHHKKLRSSGKFSSDRKMTNSLVSVTGLLREMTILMLHTWDGQDTNLVTDTKLNSIGLEKILGSS